MHNNCLELIQKILKLLEQACPEKESIPTPQEPVITPKPEPEQQKPQEPVITPKPEPEQQKPTRTTETTRTSNHSNSKPRPSRN